MTRPDLPGPQVRYPMIWGDDPPPKKVAGAMTLRAHLAFFRRIARAERTGMPLPEGFRYWDDHRTLKALKKHRPAQGALAL